MVAVEREPFGVEYERFALAGLWARLVRRHRWQHAVEIPAAGAKAMPSIYSLGLAAAGVPVTLVNPAASAEQSWQAAGVARRLSRSFQADPHHTDMMGGGFDLAWSFASLPSDPDPAAMVAEMARISRRHVMVFSVNGRNVGAYIHRGLHRVLDIPWTHGDKALNYPENVAALMERAGLRVAKVGVVDCPPWPDSLGFRDVRLHRAGVVEMEAEWESAVLEWTRTGAWPLWLRGVHLVEALPMVLRLKYLYSHIFWVMGEKG